MYQLRQEAIAALLKSFEISSRLNSNPLSSCKPKGVVRLVSGFQDVTRATHWITSVDSVLPPFV